jgi:hypothetical protein
MRDSETVMNKLEQITAARKLVEFVRAYTVLQEQQLNAIRVAMERLVVDVMGTIKDINHKTQAKSQGADVVLISASSNDSDPASDRTQPPIVFHKISGKSLEEYENIKSGSGKVKDVDADSARVRRIGGRFTKHMEALSTLDADLSDLMFRMMGALSGDDVIRQWLEHVMQGVEVLSASLSQLVENAESAFTERNVDTLKARILTDLYRSYTSEEEKQIFHGIFGRPIGVRKAS